MTFTTTEFAAQQRRPRWPWIVVGTCVLVVGLVVALVVVTRSDQPSSSASAGPASPAPTDLTAPPANLEWKLIGGVRLPFSKVDGPASVDGAVATGYSHTPQGAVVAAWHISTRLLSSPNYEQILATQVRGTQAERTEARGVVAQIRNLTSEQFTTYFTQPAGFRIEMYTPAFAQMYFATRSPNGGYDFTARAALWNGTDWEYQIASGLPKLPNSTSLDGFTLF